MMTNAGEVYFCLLGKDFNPDEITRLIGIEPTSVNKNRWIYSSGKIEADLIDIYAISSALVVKLLPHVEAIAAVKSKLKLEAVLQVVLRFSTDETKSTPAIGFEEKVVAFLNKVGASIDIDTYLS